MFRKTPPDPVPTSSALPCIFAVASMSSRLPMSRSFDARLCHLCITSTIRCDAAHAHTDVLHPGTPCMVESLVSMFVPGSDLKASSRGLHYHALTSLKFLVRRLAVIACCSSAAMGAEGFGGRPGEQLNAIMKSHMPTDTLEVISKTDMRPSPAMLVLICAATYILSVGTGQKGMQCLRVALEQHKWFIWPILDTAARRHPQIYQVRR